MNQNNSIIRKTTSVCPICLKKIDANIIEKKGEVYLQKTCSQHGPFDLLLSHHPEYYRGLTEYYFPLMKESFPQHDYILHLTNKCNLRCPICLADANERTTQDYPSDKLKKFLEGKKGYKIDLMGAEPTMRDDLTDIIQIIKASGNIAALHTNGLRIADFQYLEELKNSGLDEVHLQFDGFDDHAYELIRGKKLLQTKLASLRNLEKLGIATDLVVTIVKGVNENEMSKVLDYGVRYYYIKEIFFLGCRYLGKAKELTFNRCLMPDELIDMLESQTHGRISRSSIFKFQKLYFALLSAFSIRKCFYIHHYMVTRNKERFIPIDKVINLDAIQDSLDRYKTMKTRRQWWAFPYLNVCIVFKMLTIKSLILGKDLFTYIIPFITGFNLSKLSSKSILLGFISACDAYSLDFDIAKNCGKGALSIELGQEDSGAIDNVNRDHNVNSIHL